MTKNGDTARAQTAGRIVVPDASTADNAYLPRPVEGQVAEYLFESDGFRQMCPRLYTLLAKQIVNGKKREVATIRFFADGGRLKAAIHDRETSQTWWTTLEAKLDPCVELEASLIAQSGEWRKDRPK